MRIAAIDPGITGALALLEDGVYRAVVDMPTMARSKTGKKQQVNAAHVATVLQGWSPDAVVIEFVQAMPRVGSKAGMGAASAFNFGESAGVVRGVVATLGLEAHFVTPQSWKKRAGLVGADKEASRAKAQLLWPDAPLARKKDQGRAEALLIARYGVAEFDVREAKRDPFRLVAS